MSGKAFLTKLDELNVLILESYYAAQNKEKEVIDDLFDWLVEAYLLGVDDASEMMDQLIPVEMTRLEQAVWHPIEGRDFSQRAAEHIRNGDVTALQTLAQAEYHRVYNTAAADGIDQYVQETGFNVLKTWHTVGDDRVRDTHVDLEGVAIPRGEEFHTIDGDHALYPGGFENAENNVNCRCWLTYRRENA